MKPLNILVEALQDIITTTFDTEEDCIIDSLKNISSVNLSGIREIAQKALKAYKRAIPKPPISCPKGFIVGEDYKDYEECGHCPDQFSQVCSIYNYVWYKGGN